jgi:hypothetical protein
MMSDQPPPVRPASAFKRGVAATLDFLTVFFVGGYVIGKLTGETTAEGFSLSGGAAIALFALIVVYFYVGRKVLGGTLWDRILGIARPQPY